MPEIHLPELNQVALPAEAQPAALSEVADALNQALEVAHTQLDTLAPEILARVADAADAAETASNDDVPVAASGAETPHASQQAGVEAPSLPEEARRASCHCHPSSAHTCNG
jgi:hypothetical protein